MELCEKNEQRSNGKRSEDRTCEAIREEQCPERRSRVILSNVPEIEVGDCSIVLVVLCATSIGAYVVKSASVLQIPRFLYNSM